MSKFGENLPHDYFLVETSYQYKYIYVLKRIISGFIPSNNHLEILFRSHPNPVQVINFVLFRSETCLSDAVFSTIQESSQHSLNYRKCIFLGKNLISVRVVIMSA